MKNAVKWLWMQQTFGIGTRHADEVLRKCGGPDELLSLEGKRLEKDTTLTKDDKLEIASPDFSKAEKIIDDVEKLGWTPIAFDDEFYPERLRDIYSPPMVLYAKGDVSLLSETYAIATVGTRSCDEYGARAARKISTEIAGMGAVVVSGLARGIDSICHEAALDVKGKTIAFLAAGPDSDYPRTSRALRERIEREGLVVTEFPPNSQVRGYTFHVRNRLISGISLATVVIEASKHSGSLITAGHAMAQDRDVYAVCGDIFSLKLEGNHRLLSEGAQAVFSGVELMRGYEALYGEELVPVCTKAVMDSRANPVKRDSVMPTPEKKPSEREGAAHTPERKQARLSTAALSCAQEKVYLACEGEMSFDTLCERCEMPVGQVLSVLTQLEIFGYVESIPGRRYRPIMK